MNNKPFVIEIKNLNKSFAGKPAVINLALKVREGDICGFLGPNGSGKTTTLRMLCGLLIPDSGEGSCLGYNILTQSYQIKRQVGYMTQSFSLYHDLTAFENLDFIARVYSIENRLQKIQRSLDIFNLNDKKNQLAGNLSGGWKQRLALAGCLLHEPKLLLLDEPTAGVDPKARRDFWDEIHKLSAQGITTLVSTHYMDEAERCSQLAYIAYGHLLAQGTTQEIIQHAGLHTYAISGDHLTLLAEKLKNQAQLDVVFFGSALHVSGKNETKLADIMQTLTQQNYQIKKIPTTLEDVFIHLVSPMENET